MRCAATRTPFKGDAMSSQNFTFMFYGFTAAWLIIIVYVISIALREKRLRNELDRVKRMVEEGEQAKK
jgi:CcmD family protein